MEDKVLFILMSGKKKDKFVGGLGEPGGGGACAWGVSKFSLHPDEYLGRLKPKVWVQIHSLTLQVTLPKSVDRKN